MCDEIDLLQLLAAGDKLVSIDGCDYIAVHLVYELPAAGGPRRYCQQSDWPTTPAARLAARDQELAELSALLARTQEQALDAERHVQALLTRTAELERRLAERPTEQAAAPAAGVRLSSNPGGGREQRIECAICHNRIWPSLFDEHMAKHTRIGAIKQDPVVGLPPIVLVEDSPIWRCQECGTNTHARSIRNPDFCQRCAKNRPIASMNGQLAAA